MLLLLPWRWSPPPQSGQFAPFLQLTIAWSAWVGDKRAERQAARTMEMAATDSARVTPKGLRCRAARWSPFVYVSNIKSYISGTYMQELTEGC